MFSTLNADTDTGLQRTGTLRSPRTLFQEKRLEGVQTLTDGSGTEEGGNAQAWRFSLKKQNADNSARRTHTEQTASHRLPREPPWGRQATGWRWVAWTPLRRPGNSHPGEAHVRLRHTEVCRWQADTLDCHGGDHWKGAGGRLEPGTLYKIIQKTEENDRSSQLLT